MQCTSNGRKTGRPSGWRYSRRARGTTKTSRSGVDTYYCAAALAWPAEPAAQHRPQQGSRARAALSPAPSRSLSAARFPMLRRGRQRLPRAPLSHDILFEPVPRERPAHAPRGHSSRGECPPWRACHPLFAVACCAPTARRTFSFAVLLPRPTPACHGEHHPGPRQAPRKSSRVGAVPVVGSSLVIYLAAAWSPCWLAEFWRVLRSLPAPRAVQSRAVWCVPCFAAICVCARS